VRLAYLEPQRLKLLPVLARWFMPAGGSAAPGRVPEMYLDVLASRLGMHDASDEALRIELNRYSLKTGLAGPSLSDADFWLLEKRSVQPEESRA
jgi:esterase FrsA